MTAFLQYIVTGVSDGAAYALVGIGLVIVFRTTNALNFAQGVYAVVAGLTTSALALHMPIVLAALIAIALTTSSPPPRYALRTSGFRSSSALGPSRRSCPASSTYARGHSSNAR